jgi:hypothetical protein
MRTTKWLGLSTAALTVDVDDADLIASIRIGPSLPHVCAFLIHVLLRECNRTRVLRTMYFNHYLKCTSRTRTPVRE